MAASELIEEEAVRIPVEANVTSSSSPTRTHPQRAGNGNPARHASTPSPPAGDRDGTDGRERGGLCGLRLIESLNSKLKRRCDYEKICAKGERADSLPNEWWKTGVAFLYAFFNLVFTTVVITIVHERVPDKSVSPPLPDKFFDYVDRVPWAFTITETNGLILSHRGAPMFLPDRDALHVSLHHHVHHHAAGAGGTHGLRPQALQRLDGEDMADPPAHFRGRFVSDRFPPHVWGLPVQRPHGHADAVLPLHQRILSPLDVVVPMVLLGPQRLRGHLHPGGSRALQHRRGHRLLRHHQDLLVVPHHGQHSRAARRSKQLPVPGLVEPGLQVPGEERPDDGPGRVPVAAGAAVVLQGAVPDDGRREGRVRTALAPERTLTVEPTRHRSAAAELILLLLNVDRSDLSWVSEDRKDVFNPGKRFWSGRTPPTDLWCFQKL
ncbi:uncharacterized protein sgms2b isoform 1-T1 [Anableps anableps]